MFTNGRVGRQKNKNTEFNENNNDCKGNEYSTNISHRLDKIRLELLNVCQLIVQVDLFAKVRFIFFFP